MMKDQLNSECPHCNKAIADDDRSCPHCEAILAESDTDKAIEGPETIVCPFCNKEVSEYHESCPHCDADLLIERQETTRVVVTEPEEIVSEGVRCPLCDGVIPPEKEFCEMCLDEIMDDVPNEEETAEEDTGPEEVEDEPEAELEAPADEPRTAEEKHVPEKEEPPEEIVTEPPRAEPIDEPSLSEEDFVSTQDQETESDAAGNIFFPKAILPHSHCTLTDDVIARIEAIKPTIAPRAVLSLNDEIIYYLIAGSTLHLGRKQVASQIPAILFPEKANQHRNLKVSREHCRIMVRNTRVFIRDLSVNGTFLDGERLKKDVETPLLDGSQIGISDVLTMEAVIYTDGVRIMSVRLNRLANTTEERYILAFGPVPIGGNPAFPVPLEGSPDHCGSIYFDPAKDAWMLLEPPGSDGRSRTVPLDTVEELNFGPHQILFSCINE